MNIKKLKLSALLVIFLLLTVTVTSCSSISDNLNEGEDPEKIYTFDVYVKVIDSVTEANLERAEVTVENYQGEKVQAAFVNDTETYEIKEIKLKDTEDIDIEVTKEGYLVKGVSFNFKSTDGDIFISVRVERASDVQEEFPNLVEGITMITERPEHGFHWPYFVYIPEGYFSENGGHNSAINRLLIEPVNSGRSSDSHYIHLGAAESTANWHSRGLGKDLNIPVLVPSYPRPRYDQPSGFSTYTHALDRETLLVDEVDTAGEYEKLHRVDKQLVAMADHFMESLSRNHNVYLENDFFVFGFSASGNFTNRFAFLHADRVAAAAAGGLNGMPLIPKASARGKAERELDLIYSVGLYDILELSDMPIDMAAYRNTPQLLIMGSEDGNDTLGWRDCFRDEERDIILEFFATKIINPPESFDFVDPEGKYYDDVSESGDPAIIVDRFLFANEMYADENIPARFLIFEGLGHSFGPSLDYIYEFFQGGYKNIDTTELEWIK